MFNYDFILEIDDLTESELAIYNYIIDCLPEEKVFDIEDFADILDAQGLPSKPWDIVQAVKNLNSRYVTIQMTPAMISSGLSVDPFDDNVFTAPVISLGLVRNHEFEENLESLEIQVLSMPPILKINNLYDFKPKDRRDWGHYLNNLGEF